MDACRFELQMYIAVDSPGIYLGRPPKAEEYYVPPEKKRKIDYVDPLGWWKENRLKFPTLAKLAKFYLSIQATSASSERLFTSENPFLGSGSVYWGDPSIKGIYV